MKENLKSRKAQVCDSRGPNLFNRSASGKEQSTVDMLKWWNSLYWLFES